MWIIIIKLRIVSTHLPVNIDVIVEHCQMIGQQLKHPPHGLRTNKTWKVSLIKI